MSQYRGHVLFNIYIGLPITIGAFYYLLHPSVYLLIVLGLSFVYGTLYMSPDMDYANKIRVTSLRGFLTLPFRSYSRVFKHRGMSHSIFLGTFTRLVWLLAWFFLISYAADFFFGYQLRVRPLPEYWNLYRPYIIYMVAGLFFADMAHLVMDLKKG